MSAKPQDCVVLVPVGGAIEPACDEALRQLELRGYEVRRVRGYAAIDQGRNQMATDALADGFAETLWIDSDMAFHPDDVERLRAHALPVVAGIYPQKGKRALACHVMPGTDAIQFGSAGGLMEILYAGTGFLLVRRVVYETIWEQLQLPLCNERFGERPMLPFFQPLVIEDPGGAWYLAEDFAFCQRARQCGYRIMADSSIRLGHIGKYEYSWEDAGTPKQRFASYAFHLNHQPPSARTVPVAGDAVSRFFEQHPWPAEKPKTIPNRGHGWFSVPTREMLLSVLTDQTRLVCELGSWLGLSTRWLAEHAPNAFVIAIDHWKGNHEDSEKLATARLLPRLYETFLANCWDYRQQIIPVRLEARQGLEALQAAQLVPDVFYMDADHSQAFVAAQLRLILDHFPTSEIVGDDWDWGSVQMAVGELAAERGLAVETNATGWRIAARS